jgi:acyl-[acyl-carrier-protein]-phospholipid O-acyltransferase/long-chain-fatty-acid--[acyl-carrier-protein] ligase
MSLTNTRMVAAVAGLSRGLKLPAGERHIGVLLPSGTTALQAILALLLRGKVIVPLNHTLPPDVFSSMLQATSVQHVITSRAYLAALSDSGIDIDGLLQGTELVYAEDLAGAIPRWRALLYTLGFRLLPVSWFYRLQGQALRAEDPAAILLSDRIEPDPLGVLLSHRNIMANCKQMSDVLNTRLDDVVLSCIPLYHPLGLTLTTIMPLVEGIPMACHGDPLDSLGIAKSVARHRATLLPASPQTLQLYVRNNEVHPLMLDSLRLVVSGAEPLPDELRAEFELKFGKRVYEGYGMAETTTVTTVNIPDAMDTSDWKVQQGNIPGTMGMPLPGTSLKIVDEYSGRELPLGSDGLVLVCGSQVMSGYLNAPEQTAAAVFESAGRRWLRSGRRGHLTEEGFLVLRQR